MNKALTYYLKLFYLFLLSQALLDMVVKKSEGYTVEQLERLYSFLSQCIYQHRREYDKTRLLEVRQNQINVYASVSQLSRGNVLYSSAPKYFVLNCMILIDKIVMCESLGVP